MKRSDPKFLLSSACSYLAMNGLVVLEGSPYNVASVDVDDGCWRNNTDPEMNLKAKSRRSDIM